MATTHQLALISGLTLGVALPLAACATDKSGLYGVIGGGVGIWETADDHHQIVGTTGSYDATSPAYKLGAGWRFNQYVAAELAYHGGEKYKVHYDAPNVDMEMKVSRVSLSAVADIPLTDKTSLLGRLGVARWEEKWAYSDGSFVRFLSADTTWGLGAAYQLGDKTSVTMEYQHFHHKVISGYLSFGNVLVSLRQGF